MLLQVNAPVHTAQVAMAEAESCSFELLPQAPYSPDLAPSDFYLFLKLKSHICGRHFPNDDDIIDAVSEYLEAQDTAFLPVGIAKLEHRWAKCIEVPGDYVEK